MVENGGQIKVAEPETDMTLSEDDLIATLFAPLAGPGGHGLKDDAATVGVDPGDELVVTVDALVAGVHFFVDDPANLVGLKALAANLSDLAAKAAQPSGFLLTLALPIGTPEAWLKAFAAGLAETASAHGCPLLGGDTVRTPGPLTLSITAFGTVAQGAMLPRTGARSGDRLYVSGTIGDAALGLALRLGHDGLGAALATGLDPAAQAHLRQRYLCPEPRLPLGPALRACAHAGMDVSDGFVGDLRKLLRVSGAGGLVDLDRIPLSTAAEHAVALHHDAFRTAVTGGDDYELLVSVPPETADRFERLAAAAGVRVTTIGEVTADPGHVTFTRAGQAVPFATGSFQHF
jgi:thiamine-monophosphate kinase